MINKELIELQQGCEATCVVILYDENKNLNPKVSINANITMSELISVFKEEIFNKEGLSYFVINEIDQINEELQDKYYHIIKDREFYGNKLPENMIIVLTVKDRDSLKKISEKLYHFCVVAF